MNREGNTLVNEYKALSTRAKETVGEARSTVEGIVENVKDTMDDTVTRVKQSFNLQYQIDHHPWVMLSGSILAGYLLGGMGTKNTAWSYRTRRTWKPRCSANRALPKDCRAAKLSLI